MEAAQNKHTPGPWIVCTVDDNNAILSIEQDRDALVNEEPSIIAEVDLSGDGIDHEIGQANANLIAAAPELLAACKSIVDYYQNMSGNPEFPVADKHWLPGALLARAAIAKAEGRTH